MADSGTNRILELQEKASLFRVVRFIFLPSYLICTTYSTSV